MQTFGQFQLIKRLGTGGFGEVFLANAGGKQVALKILRDLDPESTFRFQREANVLASTETLKNFARIHSFGLQPSPYIAMEYIEATDLKTWRLNSDRSTDDCERIFDKILEAMEQFHRLGFVHRDLKPQNILVRTENGTKDENENEAEFEPIIIDFGLVTTESFQTLTLSGQFLGTPITMAPESWVGTSNNRDKSVDIWALGVIYYFLRNGEFPFKGTPIQIFQQIQQFTANPSAWDHVPTIQACLTEEPENRISSCEALIQLRKTAPGHKNLKSIKWFLAGLIAVLLTGTVLWAWSDFQKKQKKINTLRTRLKKRICEQLPEQLFRHQLGLILQEKSATLQNSPRLEAFKSSCQELGTVMGASDWQLDRSLQRQKRGFTKEARELEQLVVAMIIANQEDLVKRHRSYKKCNIVLRLEAVELPESLKEYQSYYDALIALRDEEYRQCLNLLKEIELEKGLRQSIEVHCLKIVLRQDLEKNTPVLVPCQQLNRIQEEQKSQSERPLSKELEGVIAEFCERQKLASEDNQKLRDLFFEKLQIHGFGHFRPWLRVPNDVLLQKISNSKGVHLLSESPAQLMTRTEKHINDLFYESMYIRQNGGQCSIKCEPPHSLLGKLEYTTNTDFTTIQLAQIALIQAFENGYLGTAAINYNQIAISRFFHTQSKDGALPKRFLASDLTRRQKLWQQFIYLSTNKVPASQKNLYARANQQLSHLNELKKLNISELPKSFQKFKKWALVRQAVWVLESAPKSKPMLRNEYVAKLCEALELSRETWPQSLDTYCSAAPTSKLGRKEILDEQLKRFTEAAQKFEQARQQADIYKATGRAKMILPQLQRAFQFLKDIKKICSESDKDSAQTIKDLQFQSIDINAIYENLHTEIKQLKDLKDRHG